MCAPIDSAELHGALLSVERRLMTVKCGRAPASLAGRPLSTGSMGEGWRGSITLD